MAIIHGKAASTKYLLDKLPEINGKKFESLKDLQQFYDNYTDILNEAESAVKKQIEAEIAKLENEEKRLDGLYNESVVRKRKEINDRFIKLHNDLQTSRNLFSKLKLRLKIYIKSLQVDSEISNSCGYIKTELLDKQNQKTNLIKNKDKMIYSKCNDIKDAYWTINANKTFLIGASGEEEVMEHLSFLPDDYHVFNDVKIDFGKWVYWKKGKEGDKNIKTSQIDHLVVGPTGMFLIETKKWRTSDIVTKQSDLVYQIQRSNYALWYYLNNYRHVNCDIKIRSIAVSIHGNTQWQKIDNHIFLMPPYSLPKYITWGKEVYSPEIIDRITNNIPR